MARPRKIDSDLRHGRHCVFALHVHLVFVTKYRRNVFRKEHLDAMQTILAKVCQDFDAELVEFNGEHAHVHLLVNYPPKVALSNLVASLKGVSARLLRQQFGDFHPWLKRRGVLWSPSYFASSCGGAPIDILRKYIDEQQTPHQTQRKDDCDVRAPNPGMNPEASRALVKRKNKGLNCLDLKSG